jgi:hypothetical protein
VGTLASDDRGVKDDRDDIRPGRRRCRRLPRLAVPAGVLVLALTAGACTGQDDEGEDATTSSPQPTGRPSSGAPVEPGVSPFTGEEGRQHAVLAVKLGNTGAARPHIGLGAADLVYVEQVEGGLSRLMAVYGSSTPGRIGPVRSARESDLELLRQFGHPAFAYSGVRSALKDDLRKSPMRRVPAGQAPNAYERDSGRAAPNNLYVRPEAALRAADDPSRPRDIGFRFGPAPDGGKKDRNHTVRYPAARFGFTWSAGQERWLVSMDGSPARGTGGDRLGPPTVVVQYVTMRPSRFRDVAGAVTPYIESVGSGRAKVLRDGKAYDVRWRRPSAAGGTTFTLPGGERMPFDRGQVWIVYAER